MTDTKQQKRDVFENEAVEAATEGARAIKAFLMYQGTNEMYEKKFKAGAKATGEYTRFLATMNNAASIRLTAEKVLRQTRKKTVRKS